MGGQDLDALDLSEVCEVRSQLSITELRWEVLYEEVALLLGVLESLLVSQDCSLSLNSSQSWGNVDFAAINSLIIESIDSVLS